jgi:hypothetical protein
MLGGDFVYIKNTGNFNIRRVNGFNDIKKDEFKGCTFKGLDTYTISLNAYYVFNHRHFSYPAAFAQSTVQRKSCGSWILGFRFDKQKIKFDYTKLPTSLIKDNNGESIIFDELKLSKIDYRNYSLSAGYAYNWVFAKNWVSNLSLLPGIGFKKSRIDDKDFKNESWIKDINFDFITRAAIVYNNAKYFVGASLVLHTYDYRKPNLSVTNSFGTLRIYAGFNFWPKKGFKNNKE